MSIANQIEENSVLQANIMQVLEEVPDPEIPVISVVDLGIITNVDVSQFPHIVITMTPTFSGCPAIQHMRNQILQKIQEKLPDNTVEVNVDFNTQWNSNMISEKGLLALKNFGLAPPKRYNNSLDVGSIADAKCPYCNSEHTTMNSPFGSTLCRAIHYCFDCKQSFEQFKPL